MRMPVCIVLAPLLMLLVSCDYKELCYNHHEHALKGRTDFQACWQLCWEIGGDSGVDWQAAWPDDFGMSYDSLDPACPTGIRAVVYNDGGRYAIANLESGGGAVDMTPGRHNLLFFNNDTQRIIFDDMYSAASARATTRSRSRTTYSRNPLTSGRDDEEFTVGVAEPFFGHYIPAYEQVLVQTPPVVDIEMKPLVFSYLVRYSFSGGLGYVAMARGALSGMARSVYLTDGHTGPDKCTVLYDCEIRPWGVEAVVHSFGIPDYPRPDYSRSAGSFGLNLEVMLTNGKILQFYYDVTAQVASQPHGGVIEVGDIIIPDEAGDESGSGFDVEIDDWGEFEDIEILL